MTASQDIPRVWGVVPAAGMSRRMGFTKQTADVHGSTMVARVVSTMLDADIAGVVVVTRLALTDSLALPADPRVMVTFNNDTDSEMIDSIRIGLARLIQVSDDALNVSQSHDGVMVMPADMPSVAVSTCRACVESFLRRPDRIVIATHRRKRGHPIVFPLALHAEATSQRDGLRGLAKLYPHRVVPVETDDPGSSSDANTPRDYRRL